MFHGELCATVTVTVFDLVAFRISDTMHPGRHPGVM